MIRNVSLLISSSILVALMVRAIIKPDSKINHPVAYICVGLAITSCVFSIGLAIYRIIKEKQAPQEQ
jgi:hypothetical protein